MPGFQIAGIGDGPPNTKETLRTHRWKIIQLGNYITRDLALLAKDVELPELLIDRQEILGTSLVYKYAKRENYPDCNITFYDDGQVINQLFKWKKSIIGPIGIQKHSTYKQTSIIYLLDGKGELEIKITFKNSWPAKIGLGSLSYTRSDLKLVNLALAYDNIEIESLSEVAEIGNNFNFSQL